MRTRLFELEGIIRLPNSAGTITINGQQIFSGLFAGPVVPLPEGEVFQPMDFIITGSYTLDDSQSVFVPVTITLTAGEAHIGMFEWNYAPVIVPGSDPVQYTQDPDAFSYGFTPEDCDCNRRYEQINGQPAPTAGTCWPMLLTAGDVATFETKIFAGPKAV